MDMECTGSDSIDSFVLSCFEYCDGSYSDTDLALPCNVNDSSPEANRETEEFEFRVSVSATDKHSVSGVTVNVTPADDLFYRGQLLPLHLPRRLEMVRNLTSPRELEGDADGFDRYSSCSRDSNQRPSCCEESCCRCAETEEKIQSQPMGKSATKLKVKVPMFGFSKSSKVGMDDFNHSPPVSPPTAKALRFAVKFNSVKAASKPALTADYSTKQNPDYPLNSSRTSATTSVKHIVKKYVRLVKHRICSQRHNDAQTGNQKLKLGEEDVWHCIADDSRRQNHVGKRCLPSMNSSPNMCSDDLQSAIAYCKQSNGGIDKRKL